MALCSSRWLASGLVYRERNRGLSMATNGIKPNFPSGGPVPEATSNRRSSDRLLLSTRFALGIGFGSLLAIMALAGLDGIRVLRQIRRNDDQIRRQFLSRNHALNDIRSELYLSGTYVRDYLLEPEPGRAGAYRTSLEEARRGMESALELYGRQQEPEQAKDYAELRTEISRYWEILGPTLQWNATERRRQGYAFLRDEVFPRRAAVLGIAGRIANINEQQLSAGNQRVDHLLLTFQRRLAATLLAALALGLVWRRSAYGRFSDWKPMPTPNISKWRRLEASLKTCPPGLSRRKKRSGELFRESCTMRWARRSPPSS